MAKVRTFLMAAAAAAPLLGGSAKPATALFGPICIPSLPNCNCTFQVPCPVSDSQKQSKIETQNQNLDRANKLLTDINKSTSGFAKGIFGEEYSAGIPGIDSLGFDLNGLDLKGILNGNFESLGVAGLSGMNMDLGGLDPEAMMNGDLSSLSNALGIPGLDELGIDPASLNIQGIMNGDLSSLSDILPPEVTGVADNLSQLGISPDTLTSLVNGDLASSDFMQIAEAAGIDTSQLERFGLSPDRIESLASGNLDTSQIFSMAGDLGIQGNVLKDIGITPELIENVAAGNMDPSAVLHIAQNAGLDMSQLEAIGLGEDTLSNLAGGASPEQVMKVIQNAGLDQSPISALGIDAEMLGQIASGKASPEQIATMLQGTGIDPSAIIIPGANGPVRLDGQRVSELEDIVNFPVSDIPGLQNVLSQSQDIGDLASKIESLPEEMQGQVVAKIQELQSSIQGQLKGQISQIQSQVLGPLDGEFADVQSRLEAELSGAMGEFPITGKVTELLNGNGVDINAILSGDQSQIMGKLDGAISNIKAGNGPLGGSVTDLAGNASGGSLSEALSGLPGGGNGISQSLGGLGGLGGAFGSSGPASMSGALGGGGMSSLIGLGQSDEEMCQEDLDRIAADAPPNAFGDDQATIDLAISGGSLETFPDSLADLVTASQETASYGFARALIEREVLIKAYEHIQAMQEMIDNSASETEDWAINATIRDRLQTARAESLSLMTFIGSSKAARVLARGEYSTPVPIFPQDTEFEEAVKEAFSKPRANNAERIDARSTTIKRYNDARKSAKSAIHSYNSQVNGGAVEATLPALIDVIERHEAFKDQMVAIEAVIRSGLRDLYGEDAGQAWERLRPQLYAAAGAYTDPSKWQAAYQPAIDLSIALTAQAPETEYGARVVGASGASTGAGSQMSGYATTTFTPASYAEIENLEWNENDPFDVLTGYLSMGGDAGAMPGTEFTGAFQYYMALKRRTDWAAEPRRADADYVSMTSTFWNEMITHAPQCLSGPFEVEAFALETRPEMFDLDPECTHIVWEGGDAGDYISGNQLGGVDAAIWRSKILLDRIDKETGGELETRIQLDSALSSLAAIENDVADMAPKYADHVTRMKAAVEDALYDTEFTTKVKFPSR